MAKPLPDELSEDQISIILSAARPLPIADRDAFLDDVAEALDRCPELGDGAVFETVPGAAQRSGVSKNYMTSASEVRPERTLPPRNDTGDWPLRRERVKPIGCRT
jgi:hypothetical protein